jgi:hypothetical protein
VIHKKQSVFDECDEKYLWRSKRSRWSHGEFWQKKSKKD